MFGSGFNSALNEVATTDWYQSTPTSYNYGLPYGRVYVSGWNQRVEHSETVSRTTIYDTGSGTGRSVSYQSFNSANAGQCTYEAIRARCLASNTLWEDPDFPAAKESLFYKKAPSAWPNVKWKRPKEICSNPELFVGGASRLDVVQGILGDCWLLAAVSCLTTNESLMAKVIPPGQSFSKDYAGIFRFQFWQYGRWVEVLIDDRLPTTNNQLIYMHSEERNEFWSALLEKAYAKLNTSYESLSGGLISEALTDLTGGVVERFELGRSAPNNMLDIMLKAQKKQSLMGCSIDVTGSGRMEQELANGLLVGHAYSVTGIRLVHIKTSRASGEVPLVRVRNPWGDKHEWNGAWSDRSPEWNSISKEEKSSLGLTFENDGEFWMSFKDFVANFQRLEICYLGPDSFAEGTNAKNQLKEKWAGNLFEGSWRRRVNAGGCRNYPSTFWTNPQYRVRLTSADSDDGNGNGSIIVGVMQKDRRKLRKEGQSDLTIGYAVYKAPPTSSGTLDQRFFQTNSATAKSSAFSNLREVSDHHNLPPGDYVVVPSTFEPNEEGDFILRIFSEHKSNKAEELDDVTGQVEIKEPSGGHVTKPEDKVHEDAGRQAFLKIAGPDQEVDAFKLLEILNGLYQKEFKFGGFSIDLTRSMVAMCDTDLTGKLSYQEYLKLQTDLIICKHTFRSMDTNNDGYFDSYEFKTALNSLGIRVSNATFNAIVMRYSDQNGHVLFNDFVAAYIKLKMLFALFNTKDSSNTGRARFSVEEFAMYTMYS